jgi:hypothetical protein
LYDLRSGTLFASTTGASSVILFKGGHEWWSDFTGEFFQFTNQHSTLQWDFNIPDEFYYNPGGGSIPLVTAMLVLETQRRNEFRISFRDSVLPLWHDFANEHLPDEVILKGNPELTWTAFPNGPDSLSEGAIYLRISQDIEIDFSDLWSNYDASFNYWLHLHLNNGRMTGHVARWSYWIEGGAFTSVIEQILRPNVELGAIRLTEAINQVFGGLPPNIRDFYYLPGRQLTPLVEGEWRSYWADTNVDVTIVFEV